MNVVLDGLVPSTESAFRAFPPRLLVRCPATGRSTDTGFDLLSVPMNAAGRQLLVDCLECGQDHEWQVRHAFLA